MPLRSAADEAKVILRHREERRHFAARGFLAVQAVTVRDKVGVFVELEPHRAAGTSRRVFLSHRAISWLSNSLTTAVVSRLRSVWSIALWNTSCTTLTVAIDASPAPVLTGYLRSFGEALWDSVSRSCRQALSSCHW